MPKVWCHFIVFVVLTQGVLAQRIVFDPGKLGHLLLEFGIEEAKTGANEEQAKQEEEKRKQEDSLKNAVGPAVKNSLPSDTLSLAVPIDAQSLKDRQSQATSVDGKATPLTEYLTWQEKSRVSHAAVREKIAALSDGSNGRALDWNTQYKLAAELNAATNEAYAAMTIDSANAAEARAKQKAEEAAYWQRANATEARSNAQSIIAPP